VNLARGIEIVRRIRIRHVHHLRGNIADLVMLDGNPVIDIANTRRVSAVFFRRETSEVNNR